MSFWRLSLLRDIWPSLKGVHKEFEKIDCIKVGEEGVCKGSDHFDMYTV